MDAAAIFDGNTRVMGMAGNAARGMALNVLTAVNGGRIFEADMSDKYVNMRKESILYINNTGEHATSR
jgi:hypothetical protein